MKANEFIKEFGYSKADHIWRSYPANHVIAIDDGETFTVQELGQLLKSKDLIKKVGGLKRAKAKASNKFKPVGRNLLKASADVESCQ